jgi:hypothetical protein
LDEITAGIIKLSDAVSVKWLKSLHNTIWHAKGMPDGVMPDLRNQLLIPLHNKGIYSKYHAWHYPIQYPQQSLHPSHP